MGCNESQSVPIDEKNVHQYRQYTQIKPVMIQQDAFEAQQFNNANEEISKKMPFNAVDISMRPRENQQESIDGKEDSNRIKVKKAKKYRIRPEHEKFIENILESNRNKAITESSMPSNKSSLSTLKKTAISLYSKTQESILDKQNITGHKQKAQKSIKSPSVSGKCSKKQAQKLKNNMLQGKLDQQELNQIGERMDLEQLDSNATLHL